MVSSVSEPDNAFNAGFKQELAKLGTLKVGWADLSG
jgi:hypothetical protein